MKRITLLLSLVVLLTAGLMANPGISFADTKSDVCTGAGIALANCSNSAAATTSINNTLAGFITVFSAIVGIVAVIMIILAGWKFITSGGDTSKVASAKTSLIYAIVGLVVVALSQVIVHFVLANVK